MSTVEDAPTDAVLQFQRSGVLCLLGEIKIPGAAPLESRTLGLGVICVPVSLYTVEGCAASVPDSLIEIASAESETDLECAPLEKMSER